MMRLLKPKFSKSLFHGISRESGGVRMSASLRLIHLVVCHRFGPPYDHVLFVTLHCDRHYRIRCPTDRKVMITDATARGVGH